MLVIRRYDMLQLRFTDADFLGIACLNDSKVFLCSVSLMNCHCYLIFNAGGAVNKSRRSIGTPRINVAENFTDLSLVSPCQDVKKEK